MKPVLLVVAQEGFQGVEYARTRDGLEAAGIPVAVASVHAGEAFSHSGRPLVVDYALADVTPSSFSGIFVIGGPGALRDLDTPLVHALVRTAREEGLPYGAICIAPRILAHAGVLAGARVTGWDEDHALDAVLSVASARFVPQPVVRDGDLVTADGPFSAEAFGTAVALLVREHAERPPLPLSDA